MFKKLRRIRGFMVRGRKSRKEYLHMHIDVPSFELELETQQPGKVLSDLRKIFEESSKTLPQLHRVLEHFRSHEEVAYEEFVIQEMRQQLSPVFVENQKVLETVRHYLQQEDDYRIARVGLSHDIESGGLQVQDVRRTVAHLLSGIDTGAVHEGIVHINGDVPRTEKLMIVDQIHKQMPTVQLKAFQSHGDGKPSVECMFFGEFESET
jgi:hypothetical protein